MTFAWYSWRYIGEMMAVGNEVFTELKNVCVWAKTNAGMGSFYRSQHELVFVWKSGTAPHVNNFKIARAARSQQNQCLAVRRDHHNARLRLEELALHPTVKPVALVADAIKDCSRRNGVILDPGSGRGPQAPPRSGPVVAHEVSRSTEPTSMSR